MCFKITNKISFNRFYIDKMSILSPNRHKNK